MLVKFVGDKKESWSSLLDTCVFAYNTSRQESTKFTPFQLMFNRQATIPIDLELQKSDSKDLATAYTQLPDVDQDEQEKRRMSIIEEAKKNIEVAQQKQKTIYDRKHAKPHCFEKGQLVLKLDSTRRKRKGGKLDPKYLGPFKIIKALGNGTYHLADPKKPNTTLKATGSHIKPYKVSSSILQQDPLLESQEGSEDRSATVLPTA